MDTWPPTPSNEPSGTSSYSWSTFPSNGPTSTSSPTRSPGASIMPTILLSPSRSPVLELLYLPSSSPSNSPTHSLRPTNKNTKSNAPTGLIFVTKAPSPIPSFRPSSTNTKGPSRPSPAPFTPPPVDYDAQWKWMENSVLVTTVWILFLVAMIICPFIGNASKRAICRRRIAQRRWNVELTNHELELVHSDHSAMRR